MSTTQQPENKGQTQRPVAELVEDIESLTTEIQELYCLDAIPWVVGYSGGKDSTATLQLVWNAIPGFYIPSALKQYTLLQQTRL